MPITSRYGTIGGVANSAFFRGIIFNIPINLNLFTRPQQSNYMFRFNNDYCLV